MTEPVLIAQPVRLYRPSNGTEGISFFESWCARCKHDKAWNGEKPWDECGADDLCKLIGDSMAYDLDDPKYPREWVIAQNGHPMCLKFEDVGKPYRCPRTPDMFNKP
jgi:hypothetical protein